MSEGRSWSWTPRNWLERYPRAVPLAIFLMTMAITILSVFAIERVEDQRERAQLRQVALGMSGALERRADSATSSLRAGAALFATLESVPRPVFRRFVSELRLDANYRGAEGFGWAPALSPGQIPAFEAETYDGGRRVQPPLPADSSMVVPVAFLQPDTERNRRALGFDMYSEETRREAMDKAARSAKPTATGRLVLLQEGEGSRPGFIIYMPVYRTVASGRELKGFVYSPFNAHDFLSSAAALESIGNTQVSVFDGSEATGEPFARLGERETGNEWMTESITVADRPWTVAVRSTANGSLSLLSVVTLLFGLLVASLLLLVARLLTQQALEDSVALRWFEEQASIRNSLTRELNHRVKNTLANVLSIVALTRRRATSLEDFADGLDGRVRALSATHDLLTRSEWGTTPLRAVLEAEMAPYAGGTEAMLELDGPDGLELAPNDALSLGLAIHELATNAAKYGALSVPGGKVSVSWRSSDGKIAELDWVESGGPPVTPPSSRGFGTDLIEKIVAHELRSPVDLRFDRDGVKCSLRVPLRLPVEFAMRAKKPPEISNYS